MRLEDRLQELTPEQRELFELFLKKERLSLAASSRYRGPSDATEETLAKIWSELLGVEPGVDDNYFELGGDSITIIRMVARARAEGVGLKAAWVFSHSTIAGLAALSRTPQPEVAAAALPRWEDLAAGIRDADSGFARILAEQGARPVDAFPLTPLQQGILYHALDRGADGAYLADWVFTLKGPLDLPRFRRAWQQVVERHDALRTIFQWVGVDEPLQVVLDRAAAVVVEEERLGGDERAIRAAVLEDERRTPFDLRRAPLMRIRLVRTAEDEWIGFWVHHHLILDGWSQQVVLEDFFAAYRGIALPPIVPGAFRSHVYWRRSNDAAPAIDFWREQFDGYQPPAGPLVRSDASAHAVATRSVPAGATRELLRRHAVTLSVLYQAVWGMALSDLAGRADIVFGAASSGRSSGAPGIDRAVGLFLNTLPFRLTVDPSLELTELLKIVQARQARLVAYEWCGLISVQNWIGWNRRRPLVESVYVYERFPLDLARLAREEGLKTSDIETTTREHYPLVFVVQDDDDTTRLTLKHAAAGDGTAHAFDRRLGWMATVAERWAAQPSITVGDLLAGMERPDVDATARTGAFDVAP